MIMMKKKLFLKALNIIYLFYCDQMQFNYKQDKTSIHIDGTLFTKSLLPTKKNNNKKKLNY